MSNFICILVVSLSIIVNGSAFMALFAGENPSSIRLMVLALIAFLPVLSYPYVFNGK